MEPIRSIVAIIGNAGSGKSTLVESNIFSKLRISYMQDDQLFEFASSDPKGFLNTYKNEHGLIIDEAQYTPQLFPQINVEAG